MSDVVERLAELTAEQKEELLAQLLREQAAKQSGARRFPLSFAQRRLWFIDQVEEGSSLYNLPTPLCFRGQLNVKAPQRSLNELIRRHEALRTTFELNPQTGEPEQVVHPWQPLTLPLRDLSHSPEPQREQIELLKDEAQAPFDLMKGPLLRVSLVKLSAEEHVLMMTTHHIINDGWSMGVLIKELATLYTAYSTGQKAALAELPIRYSDFAIWQREKWESGAFLPQLEYWRRQLAGELPVLQLPGRVMTPNRVGTRGAARQWQINRELSQQVRELSRRETVTLFMTLLATFKVLLYRYSGQTDIVVGTPIANRNRKEIEGLIGFFVNTLVLRTELGGEPSFRELLRRVKEVSLDAFKNQDVPFEKLVEELQPEREFGRNPLFQVMFVLQNAPIPETKLSGLLLSNIDVEPQTSMFDLSLSMAEDEQNIFATIHYNAQLFEADTITRMADHFSALLEAAVSNPDKKISELSLLSDRERHQLLIEWNDTKREYAQDKCIHDLFEAQVVKAPDAVAVICGDQQLSYLDLNTRANQLAHYLLELGVGPEVHVGVLVERSMEMPVALLSILKAGATYVPLDPKHPAERLSLVINDARVKVLITQKHLLDRVSDFEGIPVCLDSIAPHLSAKSTKNPNVQVAPQNLAYIIYTSGSTGRPKGVAIKQRSVITLLHWARDHFESDDIAVVLFSTSICFDLSVFELFVPLCWGGSVLIAEDILEATSLSPTCAITLINTVPSVTSAMLQFGNIPDSVRTVNLAGESLHRELVERIYQQGTVKRVLNLYGPTEDTTYSTFALIERGESGPVTIGRPISNSQVYILDRNKQPVPIGIVGELYLGGAGLARGYLNRPDLTAEKFIPNPFSNEPGARLYRTGDLALYLPDGQIEFRGRSDFQVKVRGFRVELGEIEAALLSHSAVREAVVTAVGEFQHIKRLVAYVVLNENHGAQVSDLRSFLHKRLPEYMIPSAFVVLEKLPLTSNRKVDRRALPVPDELRPEMLVTFQPARDDLELKLTQIWENVLQVHPIGVRDNFFDLGGHSMLALSLLAQLRRTFNPDLPLSMLIKAPTIESLAVALRQYRGGVPRSSLVTLNQGGSKQPIFFVHPIGGNVICYVELARHLGSDQPFYGLQSKGLDGEQPPLKRIEDMAEHYLDEMRAVQPVGPYLLGGWSMGGIIAFEMVRQLKARGQDVAMLALVDATIAISNKPFAQADETAFLTMFMTDLMQSWGLIEFDPKHLNRLGPDEQLATFLENAKKADKIPPSVGVEQLRNLLLVFKENILATWQYVPGVYPGNIILFRAEEQQLELSRHRHLGWDDWASEGVDEHIIPGNH